MQIKRWDTQGVIVDVDVETLDEAITYAREKGISLSGANLSGADLSRANLSRADLSGANLSGAKGITPHQYTPLLMLCEQPAVIRAYKLVTADGVGPFNGGIKYEMGQEYLVADANCDPLQDCGAGINVATMDWCLKNWQGGYRILVVEFTKDDIAAIPYGSDGKFRLKKCKVVREVDMRKELNWPQEEKKGGVENGNVP